MGLIVVSVCRSPTPFRPSVVLTRVSFTLRLIQLFPRCVSASSGAVLNLRGGDGDGAGGGGERAEGVDSMAGTGLSFTQLALPMPTSIVSRSSYSRQTSPQSFMQQSARMNLHNTCLYTCLYKRLYTCQCTCHDVPSRTEEVELKNAVK